MRGRKLRVIREIRWLEKGARGVLLSILSSSEPLKRQQQRSGFLMEGDRHGSSAANHPGLRRRHGGLLAALDECVGLISPVDIMISKLRSAIHLGRLRLVRVVLPKL